MQRELWETVAELIAALSQPEAASAGLQVTGMKLDLPVELVVVRTAVGFRLLLDAPHFRWDAGLRPRTGRIQLAVSHASASETEAIRVHQDELALAGGDASRPDSSLRTS